MDFKKLNEELEQILEMANSEECGAEVTEEIIEDYNQNHKTSFDFNDLQDKINFLIHVIENTPKDKLYGLKISNVRPIDWYNPISHKQVQTSVTICLGRTDNKNIVRTNSRYGLYHMKYGNNQHWGSSKQCLENIQHLLIGQIYPIKKGIHKNDPTYIDIVNEKHTYGIGLAHTTHDNETVLITCFKKSRKPKNT